MPHILHKYLQFRQRTESPTTFHRWSFLSCCAAVLERNVWFTDGDKQIYPSMYVMLVGSPGTRKSAAIKGCTKLLEESGYKKFSAQKTSKQKFVQDLAEANLGDVLDGKTGLCDATFIAADEFLDFIGVGNIEFTTLLTHLWDNHKAYKESYKNSTKSYVERPTVNLLGGSTPAGLQTGLPAEAGGTGFLSRTILVYGEPSTHKITFRKVATEAENAEYLEFFQQLGQLKGEMFYTAEGADLLDSIYQESTPLDDSRLTFYHARRLEHLHKLCIIMAALRGKLTICEECVMEANTILTFTEEHMSKSFGEYGKSRHAEATQKIIAFMEAANRPVSADEMYKACSQDLERYADIFLILQNLQRAERIICSHKSFILRKTSKNDRRKYTRFKLYIAENDYYEQYEADQQQLSELLGTATQPHGLDKT